MTGKKERRSRFGGMGSVLAQHRLLDAALGPGEGAVDTPAEAGAPATPPSAQPAASNAPVLDAAAPTLPAAGASVPATGTEARHAAAVERGAPPGPAAVGDAVSGATADVAPPRSAARSATAATRTAPAPAGVGAAGMPVIELPLDEIRPSPFQPQGRPSHAAVDAVRRAIAEAGSLDALVGTEGAVVFARLDGEAARLAELAFDIAEHGVKDPVITRVAEDGAEECLSGHRRLAAARLAGRATVPVLSRGAMSNANAAATVLSGNLHREPFTTWQEAVLITEVQERRRAEQMPADVRSLSRVMGWATGKAQARLKLRRVLSDALLAQLGDDALVEAIGRLGTKELNRVADAPDDGRRLALLRRALGTDAPAGTRAGDARDGLVVHRPRRGGGFVLEVRQEIEAMPLGDLAVVRELLEAQLARVTTRMTSLRKSS